MRELLGGKGAGIAEMTRVLGPDLVRPGSRSPPRRAWSTCARTESARRPRRRRRRGAGAPRGARRQAARRSRDPLLVSVRSGARDSMPGMMDTVLNLGSTTAPWRGSQRAPATRASRGTPTGGSCRCSATSCAACRGALRGRDRADQARARGDPGHRARHRRPARADGSASRLCTTSRQTRASSSSRPSAPSSTRGWASARWPTGASTASPTTGARRSTSSRWSTATRARRRAPAWPSRATRSPARPSPAATS